MFKAACAYVPQSTVGDILNVALVKMDYLLRSAGIDAQLLLQIHDSFILQCFEAALKEVLALANEAFNIEVVIGKYKFIIPHDIEVGPNWGELEKLK